MHGKLEKLKKAIRLLDSHVESVDGSINFWMNKYTLAQRDLDIIKNQNKELHNIVNNCGCEKCNLYIKTKK